MNINAVKRRLTLRAIARAADIHVPDWPGSCHQICARVLDGGLLPEGYRLARGRWTGELTYGPYFDFLAMWSEDIGSRRHSWIEAPDGTVIDPTRYVFEGVKPYVYFGPGDFYEANAPATD